MINRIMCFLGAPGSGKSMQTLKIKSVFEKKGIGVYRFAPGEELRRLNIQCANGGLADINTVNQLFDNALVSSNELLIIDGYPRSIEQAKHLIKNTHNTETVDIFLMHLDSDKVYNRLSKRIVCFACGNVSDIHCTNMQCEKCGSQMETRQDDISLEAINQRQEIFLSSVNKILEVFNRYEDVKVHNIESYLPPDIVLEEILSTLDFYEGGVRKNV